MRSPSGASSIFFPLISVAPESSSSLLLAETYGSHPISCLAVTLRTQQINSSKPDISDPLIKPVRVQRFLLSLTIKVP